ncbi:MAG: OB-fold domain-containing protein [Solirubrobacteraceae bacterium]
MTAPAATRRPSPDPRPVVEDGPDGAVIAGGRCADCGHPSATNAPRCVRCGGPAEPERFGPEGVVWATTTIHVSSGDRVAPYTLAYVDLAGGPRLLAHVQDGPGLGLPVGATVRLNGATGHGDPQVEPVG